MTDEQLEIRKRALINEERKNPPGWFYLSFASAEAGFLGACVVQGQGPATAIDRATRLGINPGDCEVLTVELPPDVRLPPPEARERRLSKADLERLFGSLVKGSAEELCSAAENASCEDKESTADEEK